MIKKILAILLIILIMPINIVIDIIKSIHTSIFLIVHISEGKSFVEFAERSIKNTHEKAMKELELYKDD